MVDVLLASGLAAAITLLIALTPHQGTPADARAYGLGLAIAAVSFFRRRWPLGALLVSAALLIIYNQFDYPGLFAAVPLSVTLATAWAAGRRGWALAVGLWFALTPLGFFAYQLVVEDMRLTNLLRAVPPDAALMAAVLLLGEAIRARRALEREQERSERLLLNVLPAPVAERLKESEEVIADAYPEATVLFADLVGFTTLSQLVPPEKMVEALDDLFSAFDLLAQRHGLEKIKTIGDSYMVAAGIPQPRPDHAEAMAELALGMLEDVANRKDPEGRPLALRIGIATGPVVAGVIGRSKFIYDLWGDTVNTASRMESSGLPGMIQVTESTYRALRSRYQLERRHPIEVKGKGEMVTYLLLGKSGRSTQSR